MDPARRIAWQLLRAVDEDDAYANLVLPQLIRAERRHGLSDRDAALATELGYGTLRMQGRYDAILAACSDRALDQIDPAVRDALRIGAHQLLATRIPPHAAVAVTVDLVRAEIGSGAAGFANAVLRRVSERDLDTWLTQISEALAPDEALAVRYSHPAWVVRALREALVRHGRSPAELSDLLAADNEPPEVFAVALPGLCEPEEVGEPAVGGVSPYAVRVSGDPSAIPAISQGRARIQDPGSQAVVVALADAELQGPDGGRWLDLCAGPGGKAALLGAILLERVTRGQVGPSAHLDAIEVSTHRAELVRQGVGGVNAASRGQGRGEMVRVQVGDARSIELGSSDAGYDRVLVDAPCSGLGALRRRPESRWRRRPSDLAQLSVLQRDLLARAVDAVRPGGVVGYATCSPHVAETEAVVADLLRRRPEVRLLGNVQVWWPHVHTTDAMYLALLSREPTPH